MKLENFCLFRSPLLVAQPAKMPPKKTWTDEKLYEAIFDVIDEGFTIYQAAERHGIPRRTLQNHLDGTSNSTSSTQAQPAQRLTPSQESKIVEWIKRQENLGYAPTARVVRALATSFCRKGGDKRLSGLEVRSSA